MRTPLYTRILYINGRPQPEGGTGGGGGPGTGLFDWRESVLDRIATPPGGPAIDDRYLITAPAVGAWVGHEDEIAQWTGTAWTYEVPDPGFATYVEDENVVYFYDGVSWSTAAVIPLASTPPVNVTKATAAVGVGTAAAREDHKHDVSTAVATTVGTANAEGAATSLARSDHVHDHGAQALGAGTQHALATVVVAGFMSPADKAAVLASVSDTAHKALRHLIHFIDSGPGLGFASGAYREILPAGDPFYTSEIWWESVAKTEKIVELAITRDGSKKPTVEAWTMYDTDGVTVLETVTDAVSYSGPFETSRTRTIA